MGGGDDVVFVCFSAANPGPQSLTACKKKAQAFYSVHTQIVPFSTAIMYNYASKLLGMDKMVFV